MPELPRRRPIRTAVRIAGCGGVGSELWRVPSAVVDAGVAADEVGLDAFFVERSPGLDPYVLLGAVAAQSEQIALGCLAAPAGERAPAVLAKVVTTLDVVAKGRAVLGLGLCAGRGAEPEVDGAGPGDLVALGDALEICRAMLRVPAPSYRGATDAVHEAWNEPRVEDLEPVPVALLAHEAHATPELYGDGRASLLTLGARFAEIFAVEVGWRRADGERAAGEPAGGARRGGAVRSWLDAACRDAGRLPGEVRLLAVVAPAGAGWSAGELLDRADRRLAEGYDGVVADITPADLGDGRAGDLMAALARLDG